jgi:hypothetical protein
VGADGNLAKEVLMGSMPDERIGAGAGGRLEEMKTSFAALFSSTNRAIAYQLSGSASDGLSRPMVATAVWTWGLSPLRNLTTTVIGSV